LHIPASEEEGSGKQPSRRELQEQSNGCFCRPNQPALSKKHRLQGYHTLVTQSSMVFAVQACSQYPLFHAEHERLSQPLTQKFMPAWRAAFLNFQVYLTTLMLLMNRLKEMMVMSMRVASLS
jgi:hypothetical protein